MRNRELSPREDQVIRLLLFGMRNRDIGTQLGIGLETVRTHVKSIVTKMNARNRTMAVAQYAIREPAEVSLMLDQLRTEVVGQSSDGSGADLILEPA